jgi:hypothetical protein
VVRRHVAARLVIDGLPHLLGLDGLRERRPGQYPQLPPYTPLALVESGWAGTSAMNPTPARRGMSG